MPTPRPHCVGKVLPTYGLERAESVRRYLHENGGIPLDRMSTISYGDLKPVSSSASFEGRSQNRRVLVQVLK